MARGWESKSVESQIESAESRRHQSSVPKFTPEQLARQREREGLQMSKTRVLRDLASATNQRYRESLEAALRHLNEKLAGLEE
ncbi:MAG: hypothetical protein ACR2NN_02655 [Bryobacteraceae bacterium]